jgi:hypothetical protein
MNGNTSKRSTLGYCEQEEVKEVTCVICGENVDEKEACYFHDEYCPVRDEEMAVTDAEVAAAQIRMTMEYNDCTCDNPCHPDCCPVCERLNHD